MACPYSNDNVIHGGQQHQRNMSNVVVSASGHIDQQVDDHFKKSMENIGNKRQDNKNVPLSYYHAPKSNAHSRDGSTDSSGLSSGCSGSTQSPQSLLGSVHSRTQSSPANLTSHPLSLPQQKKRGANANHHKGRSVDIDSIDVDDQPLPHPWQRTFTEQGQQYFYNPVKKIGSWVDPREQLDNVDMSLGPLPAGFEEAYTHDGHKYFINHNIQTTTWYDPRLPEDVQRPTILQRHAMQQQQQQQQPNSMQMNFGANMRLPPQGNFQTPTHSHQLSGGSGVPASQLMAPLNPPRPNVVAGGTYSPNSQKRVQDLSRERQNLRMRQEEIQKQGLLTDRISPASHPMSPTHNIGVETFSLGHYPSQGSSTTPMNMQQTGDYHFRQESTDSGLGMPPFGYSHPHTPENFLGSEFPTLNIAGIDLNIAVPTAMEMDTMEEIPQISQRDLDQVFNCRSSIRP